MVIDEIFAYNEQFVQEHKLPIIGHAPRKRMAIVTCMDCRLVQMFEQALGLERGDVLELRTAGATISENEREGAANDLIRSLAGGIYLLACAKSRSLVTPSAGWHMPTPHPWLPQCKH